MCMAGICRVSQNQVRDWLDQELNKQNWEVNSKKKFWTGNLFAHFSYAQKISSSYALTLSLKRSLWSI